MRLFFILSISLYSSLLFGQSNKNHFTQIVDSVISKSKEISLYSNSVNWDSLSIKMYSSSKNAKSMNDLKPAFEILLNGLRDHHGKIRKTSNYSILANFTDLQNSRNNDTRKFDSEIWGIVNNIDARFEYEILPRNVGYLKVVGVGPNIDGQKEAERIRNAISKLNNNKVKEWIIDLRYNGGGNINVMLAGLAPLLDIKNVLSIQDENGNKLITAEIKEGEFWYDGINVFKINNNPKIRNSKIAILTSRWTWSSGEFIAIAFKGQKNTMFFGEETGGYTTNNSWEVINNEIALVISTGIYCDRNGNMYVQNVKPDKEVVFVVEYNKQKDGGIIEAINWLKQK